MSKEAFFWSIVTALIWGVVPIFEKLGLAKLSPSSGLFIRCVGVIIGAIMLMSFKFNIIKSDLANTSFKSIIFILLGGFLASFLAQMFFYRALKTGDASRVVPIAAAYPFMTFILALIFLGEKFTMSKFIGLCFILFGIVLLR